MKECFVTYLVVLWSIKTKENIYFFYQGQSLNGQRSFFCVRSLKRRVIMTKCVSHPRVASQRRKCVVFTSTWCQSLVLIYLSYVEIMSSYVEIMLFLRQNYAILVSTLCHSYVEITPYLRDIMPFLRRNYVIFAST